MAELNFKEVEDKWHKKWEESKIFEAEPDERKKFFTSLVIAYPSGDLHIGHARTFTRGDIIARLKRMQGFNVLNTTGFHATGNRAVVMAKHVKNKEEKTIKILKELYGLSDNQIKSFEDPENIVRLFTEKGTETLKLGGFALDWRRRFISIEPAFNKFIDWQFNTLKEKGFVAKGSHPVIYCPECQSPITQADRAEGEEAIVQELEIWKYPLENGVILPAATLRPETIFAITNMFVNPNGKYVIANVGEEKWILSKSAAEKLKHQRKDILVIDDVSTAEIIGKTFSNPVTGKKDLLVLPGEFVDPDHATGIVASEPSDAPDDHIALVELRENERYLDRYELKKKDIEDIDYIPLITTPGYGDYPAIEISRKMNVKNLGDPNLVKAKKEIYKLQYHKGKLNKNAGEFEGLSVPEAIEAVKKKYKNKLSVMYAPSERVVCKDGTECYIKLLENQWFINYGNEKWKSQVRDYLTKMNIYPDFWRPALSAALDWTQNKACARKSGLGTPLPWDNEWIIETLSDSTIYMIFYLVQKYITDNKLKPEDLTQEFFDYVFLGKGQMTGIAEQIRKDVEYWYPVDWRNSAKDLVSNHLLYYIYNHIALFPEKYWPKTISVNGFVNLEGEKMSKSKGKAVTFVTAIKEYGADAVRIATSTATTPEQDSDFRYEEAEAIVKWLYKFYDTVSKVADIKDLSEERDIDKWLTSRIQTSIKETTDYLEVLQTRTAAQSCMYKIASDVKWYLRRSGGKISQSAKQAIESWVKMMSVYAPHTCEELWEKLGNADFVSQSNWPEYNENLINENIEKSENALSKTMDDIRSIIDIVGKKPQKIFVYVVPPELETCKASEEFFSKEFEAEVKVFASNDPEKYDPDNKAIKAKLGKPGIYLE